MRSFTLNGSVPTWPKCLGCALSDRAMGYTAENRSAECAACFQDWCWNGEDDDSAPSGEYAPVVGTVPAFLTQNNLTNGETTATAAVTPSSASSQPANSSGAAIKSMSLVNPGATLGSVAGVVAMLCGAAMVW